MDNKIKCPVPVDGRECGREEILDKKRLVTHRFGSNKKVVHHECCIHYFHIVFPGGNWKQCDCKQEMRKD